MATKTHDFKDSVKMHSLKFTTASGEYVGHGISITMIDDTGKKRTTTISLETAKDLMKMLKNRIDFTELLVTTCLKS